MPRYIFWFWFANNILLESADVPCNTNFFKIMEFFKMENPSLMAAESSGASASSKSKVLLEESTENHVLMTFNCIKYFRNMDDFKNNTNSLKNLVCGYCDRMFENASKIFAHMNEHNENRDPNKTSVSQNGLEFKCWSCSETFTGKRNLIVHIQNEHGDSRVGCDNCEETFKDFTKLVQHCYTVHEIPTLLACDLCENQLFSCKEELLEHVNGRHVLSTRQERAGSVLESNGQSKHIQDTEELLAKDLCESVLGQKTTSEEYEITLSAEIESDNLFSSRKPTLTDRQIPLRKRCVDNLPNISLPSTSKVVQTEILTKTIRIKQTKTVGTKDHVCSTCNKVFKTLKSLTSHIKEHEKPQECKHCKHKCETLLDLNVHMRDAHDIVNGHSCDECGKSFARNESLKVHKRLHSGELPYSCQFCERRFVSSSMAAAHLRSKHLYCCKCKIQFESNGDLSKHYSGLHQKQGSDGLFGHSKATEQTQHVCEICQKCFKNKFTLQNHHKSAHLGEKHFQCEVCSKRFFSSTSLNHHLRVHTGEKPFTCEICGKSFTSSASFTQHKIIHGAKNRFECDRCDMTFYRKPNLILHYRKHTGEKPFLCSECGKKYQHPMGLKIHTRTHTGEKPHKCTLCNKAFTNSGSLQEHYRWHRGEKRHGCQLCDARFVKSASLKLHVEKFHS